MTQFLQQLVNGLSLGSIYALIALGYTMVYGIIKLINFAHGDIYMLGAFVAFYATRYFQLNFFLALIIAMVFCGVLGVLIERIAYKPLRHATRITALITAMGVSYILEYGTQFFAGSDYWIHRSEGSIFLWLYLRDLKISTKELYEKLKEQGVITVPGEHFFFGVDDPRENCHGHYDKCLRLNYSGPQDEVREGLKLLAKIYKEYV